MRAAPEPSINSVPTRATSSGAIRDAPPEVLIALAFGAFVRLAKQAECGNAPLDEASITVSERAV